MPWTDWTLAGTAANVDRDGKIAWSNPDNAKTDDSNVARFTGASKTYSDWLRLTNFGFDSTSVPIDTVVTAIEVEMKRQSNTFNVNDSSVYLRKTSGQVGSDIKYPGGWSTSATTVTYGPSAFGTTWTPSDIHSSDFGIDISVGVSNTTDTADIYYVAIRVQYVPVGTLSYRKGGVTTECELTHTDSGIYNPLSFYLNDVRYYAQMVSTGHADASDLRVRFDNTTYAIAKELTADCSIHIKAPSGGTGSGSGTASANRLYVYKFTSESTAGKTRRMWVNLGSSGSVTLKGILFNSSGEIIQVSMPFSGSVTANIAHLLWFESTLSIAASTTYYLGYIMGTVKNFNYLTVTGGGGDISNNYTTPTDFDPASLSNTGRAYDCYSWIKVPL